MAPNIRNGGQLAVVLRQCQWELDDIAFRLPKNRHLSNPVTEQECKDLADNLEELAHLLRNVHDDAPIISIDTAPSAAGTARDDGEDD